MKRLVFLALLASAALGCDKTTNFATCPVCPPTVQCEDKPCEEHAPRCKDRCDKCKCCEDKE